MWTVNFSVKGRGPFPMEMLASEKCYPANADDAKEMVKEDPAPGMGRIIRLEHRTTHGKAWYPIVNAWEYHGWKVIEVEPASRNMRGTTR